MEIIEATEKQKEKISLVCNYGGNLHPDEYNFYLKNLQISISNYVYRGFSTPINYIVGDVIENNLHFSKSFDVARNWSRIDYDENLLRIIHENSDNIKHYLIILENPIIVPMYKYLNKDHFFTDEIEVINLMNLKVLKKNLENGLNILYCEQI